jgi:hypothetical protein
MGDIWIGCGRFNYIGMQLFLHSTNWVRNMIDNGLENAHVGYLN